MKSLMLFFAILLSFNVMANERGNGGATVICRDAKGEILSIDLLDFYNWGIMENLQFKNKYENESEVIALANKRLLEIGSFKFYKDFKKEMKLITQNWALLPTGAAVIQANDAEIIMTPPSGCAPYYIVNYRVINNQPRILVNRDIVGHELFNTIQEGGLKVHEAAYAVARKTWDDTTPARAQEITALLTADSLSKNQTARLKELTGAALYLELNSVVLKATKDFNLEVRSHSRAEPRYSSTTRIQNGNVSELAWGNWPNEVIWYFSSFANDAVYSIKKGDEFTIQNDFWTRDHELKMKRVSDQTEFIIGNSRDILQVEELKMMGVFEVLESK